nr:uncharacterized protein LOC100175941 [Ciona intestinalis]XP_026692290.1 uncharacterized protein LOC100175941 [Ciona intestinalis]|eukprot:XP_026692289.1 uncharacterized protein LOC100175941 [Ciona intestinalis]
MVAFQILSWFPAVITSLVVVYFIDILLKRGVVGLFKSFANAILLLPGTNAIVKAFTKKEIEGFIQKSFTGDAKPHGKLLSIPEKGVPIDQLQKELNELKAGDGNLSENGRLFAYVYTTHGPRFQLQQEAFKMFSDFSLAKANNDHVSIVKAYLETFMHDNALNPLVFPALRKFENEVVSMTASMLNGDSGVVGSVTSGGTESILMAMKTYRDMARAVRPSITEPNVVAPSTIHPAFEKAAHYFNIKIKHVPVSQTSFTPNIHQYEKEIDSNTILLLASAPSYPQAILDPVGEIGKLATKHNLPLHVDACFGGFMLPWVEKLGAKIPIWDFRVPAVTSISADLHKYGFATKGASVVCYRDSSIRKHQFFAYSSWSGGLFASPTMAGTRPGGHLAAAWVALRAMGQDGYIDMARKLMETTEKMKEGVRSIEGLKVLGSPLMTAFGFSTSDESLSIFGIVDVMEEKVPTPRNLRVSAYNLDHELQWDAPLSNTSKNRTIGVTYSVRQAVFDEETLKTRWQYIPHCVHVNVTHCYITNITYSPFETYEFNVIAEIGNRTSSLDQTITFLPFFDGLLYAPDFIVDVHDNTAILYIPRPPHIHSTGEVLTNFLYDDVLTYNVQYWTTGSPTPPNATDIVKLTRPATVTNITVRVVGHEPACFRLKLSGLLFGSAGWSKVRCTTSTPRLLATADKAKHVHTTSSYLTKAVIGIVGGVVFLALAIVCVKLSRAFLTFIKAKKHRDLPPSLVIVMKQSENDYEVDSYIDTEIVTSLGITPLMTQAKSCTSSKSNISVSFVEVVSTAGLETRSQVMQTCNNKDNEYVLYIADVERRSNETDDSGGDSTIETRSLPDTDACCDAPPVDILPQNSSDHSLYFA